MKKAFDFFVLNILWLVCSIPVVTVGASTCAAFYVALKIVDDEKVSVCKMFFKSFKQNFKQSTLMWCITAPCVCGLYFIWHFALGDSDYKTLLMIVAIALSVIVLCLNLFAYPIIAHYDNSFKNIIRNSIIISLLNFKTTVIQGLIIAAEVFLFVFNPWTMLIVILFGPAILFYSLSTASKKIFDGIEKNGGMIIAPASPEDEKDSAEDDDESDDDDDDESDHENDDDESDDSSGSISDLEKAEEDEENTQEADDYE